MTIIQAIPLFDLGMKVYLPSEPELLYGINSTYSVSQLQNDKWIISGELPFLKQSVLDTIESHKTAKGKADTAINKYESALALLDGV